MKLKVKRTQLMDNDAIWNAVIAALSEYDYPHKEEKINSAFLIFQYYATMESGGHEAFLESFHEDIKETGIDTFADKLIHILEKINGHSHAKNIKDNFKEIWHTYCLLEFDETVENSFYQLIEKADQAYYNQNNSLESLIESYFIKIHEDILTVID